MIWLQLLFFLIAAAIAVYTASYGVWEWKQGNRTGAAAVYVLSLAAAALPVLRLLV